MYKIKEIFFLTYIKMTNINANTYAENCVHTIEVIKKDYKLVF